MGSNKLNIEKKIFSSVIQEARKAKQKDEVPIGAILVRDGKIIAKAYNQTEKRGSFLAHAELVCIERATKKLKTKYLKGCELYVSLEPCLMCETAARLSRIDAIHYLVASEKYGKNGVAYPKIRILHRTEQDTTKVLRLLKTFFARKR